MRVRSSVVAGLTMIAVCGVAAAQTDAAHVLKPEIFHHYVETFSQQEQRATGKVPSDSWAWMEKNIPWFESSDKQFEEMYYFRWYAWQKHVVQTRRGWVITEWLPKPEMKDGFYGALPDAAPFHLGEARWLRDPKIAEDDARYWFSTDADPHKYSDALADAVRRVTLADGDKALATELLPAMEASYRLWESAQRDANGLFWSIDTRDAMEKSISGDGYRPTLNSYMYGDAVAISQMAADAGDTAAQQEYATKARTMRKLIETNLWNPKDEFYEVMSPSKDSGIRKQKKFIDPGTTMTLSGVRELIGYTPWLFDEPPTGHVVAWKQLFDPQGFAGKYGPTTAERRSPRFRFASNDQCTWNGPSWPFATTQTLTAMANVLDAETPQHVVTREEYLKLFSAYVLSQHIKLASGEVIPWIDEDLDADTDEWIAKDTLIAKRSAQAGRGNYYNHSGFADPVITGLIGLRPGEGDEIVLKPLLPAGSWSYFAMDALPYHGHLLTILYDANGKHYGRGRGLTLMVDGRVVASRHDLGTLTYKLMKVKTQ
jgi:hypothetical protein